jgi:hypothetical protein
MARTTLTKTTSPGPHPTAGVAATIAAGDVSNGNQFTWSGREILVLRNSGASTRTYTIASVADPQGRLGNITTQNILAGATHIIGPFSEWFRQADGYVYVDVSHAEVLLGVIVLPN